MHILIIIVIAFVTLIVSLSIAGLFIKKDYIIDQKIIIDRPADVIFECIKQVKNQQYYNKWWMIDPDSNKTFTGIDGTVGFVAAWDSNNKQAGKGEQEIIKVTEGERIDHEIRFERPFKGKAYAYQTITTINTDETQVRWVFYGANKYPMNLMSSLLKLNKILANDLQQSLHNLKINLEK